MKPVVTDYRPFAAFLTLFDKEVLRFRKIALHAILAPILTSILYLLVFGEVLKGKMPPNECPLFGKVCTPANPVGPCMVSTEGSCSAYFKYGL